MLTDEQLKALEGSQGDDSTVVDSLDGATVGGTIYIDPSWSTSVTIPSTYTIGTGTSSSYNWTSYNYDPAVNITSNGITMKEGSDIKVGGKSLVDSIDKIEERLGILHPNPELEDRWEQLKSLRQQYIDLEKELLEKEKMWKILKEK